MNAGVYRIVLTVNDKEYVQELSVLRDPDNPNARIALEDEDFIEQFYQEDEPDLIDRDD